jgi:hypothetical protein
MAPYRSPLEADFGMLIVVFSWTRLFGGAITSGRSIEIHEAGSPAFRSDVGTNVLWRISAAPG